MAGRPPPRCSSHVTGASRWTMLVGRSQPHYRWTRRRGGTSRLGHHSPHVSIPPTNPEAMAGDGRQEAALDFPDIPGGDSHDRGDVALCSALRAQPKDSGDLLLPGGHSRIVGSPVALLEQGQLLLIGQIPTKSLHTIRADAAHEPSLRRHARPVCAEPTTSVRRRLHPYLRPSWIGLMKNR